MTTIKNLQARAYQQSKDKGFHDNEPTGGAEKLAHDAMKIALMHSELTEALEELRNGKPVNQNYYTIPGVIGSYPSVEHARATHHGANVLPKPEGVPSELADVVIRVLDFCGANQIDLEAAIIEKLDYNATRSRMHGGKHF